MEIMQLALDLGTTLGYARLVNGNLVYGRRTFPVRRDLKSTRITDFGMWLLGELSTLESIGYFDGQHPIAVIHWEYAAFHKGWHAAHCYHAMLAKVQEIVEGQFAEMVLMQHSASEIKQHATGSGNSGKPLMIEAARRKGWDPKDDNEADALWLLDLGRRKLLDDPPLLKPPKPGRKRKT